GTGLFSLPREHGSSAQGGHFLAHRGRAACLLREWERRAEGGQLLTPSRSVMAPGPAAGPWEAETCKHAEATYRPRAVADRTAKKPRVP
ncbi:unnamed protein product, partial [Prorocentrum cordatum]